MYEQLKVINRQLNLIHLLQLAGGEEKKRLKGAQRTLEKITNDPHTTLSEGDVIWTSWGWKKLVQEYPVEYMELRAKNMRRLELFGY